MNWFKMWNTLQYTISKSATTAKRDTTSTNVEHLYNTFVNHWSDKLQKQSESKLKFYSSIKTTFGEEVFLSLQCSKRRHHIAQLRASAHDLNIERGRYKTNRKGRNISDRVCRFCCKAESHLTINNLSELPMSNPILKTEEHAITECPAYHHIRAGLSDVLKTHLMLNQYSLIMSTPILVNEFGKYLVECKSFRSSPKWLGLFLLFLMDYQCYVLWRSALASSIELLELFMRFILENWVWDILFPPEYISVLCMISLGNFGFLWFLFLCCLTFSILKFWFFSYML